MSDETAGGDAETQSENAESIFSVTLSLADGYKFQVDPVTERAASFVIDESPPLGGGAGPSPAQVLASAMASCLGSSLVFCLNKAHIELKSLRIVARGELVRNARKRLRVGSIHIEIFPEVATGDTERMRRCLDLFEDFCIVTESVRIGIPVVVGVETHAS